MTKIAVASDTFLDQGHIGTVYGKSGQIVVSDHATKQKYGLIHIPIPDLAGSKVSVALLHVFLKNSDWNMGDTLFVDILKSHKWTEQDDWHTYHTFAAGDIGGPDQGSTTLGGSHADGDEITVDIAALLQDAADGTKYFGLVLTTDANSDRDLYSSENSHRNRRPYLEITYALAPDPPTNQRPSNAASADKPKLSWFSTEQASYQVQISLDGGATTDDDSGQVFSDVTQTDTSDTGLFTAFAGLADGQTASWRVRVWNEAGARSDWTDWATWTRRQHSALAITAPASDGDQVFTTTPEFDWTFGGTETAWRLIIPAGAETYDSGKVTATDLVTELPKGTLKERNVLYTALLLVWDQYTRDAPGDQDYVLEARTFFYNGSNATAIVDSLTATPDGPAQVLDWHRASAPDAFTILIGDEIVVDQADPALFDMGGGDYEMRLLRAGSGPVDTAIYEVVAHDDATGDSLDNATASSLSGPQGIWIVDESEGIEVEVFGQDTVELTIGEDGATFMPIGQRAPVRVVDQIRGYEGTVQGILQGDDAKADMELIKAVPPGSKTEDGLGVLRLIWGQFNFPVDLGQVKVQQVPYAEGDNIYNLTFEFWQTDRPWPV